MKLKHMNKDDRQNTNLHELEDAEFRRVNKRLGADHFLPEEHLEMTVKDLYIQKQAYQYLQSK